MAHYILDPPYEGQDGADVVGRSFVEGVMLNSKATIGLSIPAIGLRPARAAATRTRPSRLCPFSIRFRCVCVLPVEFPPRRILEDVAAHISEIVGLADDVVVAE
jgi:hypothetical protein